MPEAVVTPAAPTAFVLPPEESETPAAPAEGGIPAQNEGEQATPAEPEVKPEVVTPEQAAKREGRRFERKLDKAYRQRAEALARAEVLERQLNELRQPKAAPQEGEPKLEQFNDIEEYAKAKAEHAKAEQAKEFEAKRQAETGKQHQERLISGWEEKVEFAEDKYDDFKTVVGELQPNSPFTASIMEAENGADIAYYLGKNPAEAKRIVALSPLSQVREIGKLEAKLLSEPVKPKAPSKAPAPITPLSGTAAVVSDVPTENDDTGAWIKKRSKQVHGKR